MTLHQPPIWAVGDRIEEAWTDPKSGITTIRRGEILSQYEDHVTSSGGSHRLYAVRWQDGVVGHGYLGVGFRRVPAAAAGSEA